MTTLIKLATKLSKGSITLLFIIFPLMSFANLKNAIGYWYTYDHKTKTVLSEVQFQAEKDGTLQGKIVKIMPVLGQKPTDRCQRCTGDKHDQPIQGMVIVCNMKQSGDASQLLWEHGRALDPKSGKVYRGKMWLTDNGCKLHLRGYIGFSLFGRTEVWNRARDKTCAKA